MDLKFINYIINVDWHVSVVKRTVALTCSVCVTVVMQPCSGYRLAAKQGIAVKIVAQFFKEAEDISDTADCGQSQSTMLLVKVGWTKKKGRIKFCLVLTCLVEMEQIETSSVFADLRASQSFT